MSKKVTEQDIRLPQFRDANLDDLEFDGSGEVVRKDRFEKSMRKLQGVFHGVNGLSGRSTWTCEQVVDAAKQTVNQFGELKELIIAAKNFPVGAEFYHPINKNYVKDINQDHLDHAKTEPNVSHLIDHQILDVGDGKQWEESSGWIEYINCLMSAEDIKNRIYLIANGDVDEQPRKQD